MTQHQGLWQFARWLVAVLALLLVAPAPAFARDVPPLVGHVNDTAGMLSNAERDQLEQKLTAYEQKTTNQFALLTLDTLGDDALESFSIRVVEAWKLGQKGKDNGLLLLIVKNDHKLRTEVGYGLEGTITDAFSSRVNRNVLVPAMRAGHAAAGIDQAFDLLIQQASGDAVTVPGPRSVADQSGRPDWGWLVLLIAFGPFILIAFFARRRGGGGGGWYSGGWRGGGGGFGGGGFGGGGIGGGGGGFSGGGGGFGGGGSSGSW